MHDCVKGSFATPFLVVAILGMLLISGCEGSDAKKAVTKSVEQAVGLETAKKGREVKQEVNQIMNRKIEQNRKEIEDGAAESGHPEPEKVPPEGGGR